MWTAAAPRPWAVRARASGAPAAEAVTCVLWGTVHTAQGQQDGAGPTSEGQDGAQSGHQQGAVRHGAWG